jgi:tRNA(fMet)-specific endonuclease VapC
MSLYVLDTDMLTLLQTNHPQVRSQAAHHVARLATSIITVEEQLRGWYRQLRKARTPKALAYAYGRLTESVTALARLRVLTFPEPAIARYSHIAGMRLNVGKNDLRIAAIVLEVQAVLVSRNVRDFQRIPGLQVEDWSR